MNSLCIMTAISRRYHLRARAPLTSLGPPLKQKVRLNFLAATERAERGLCAVVANRTSHTRCTFPLHTYATRPGLGQQPCKPSPGGRPLPGVSESRRLRRARHRSTPHATISTSISSSADFANPTAECRSAQLQGMAYKFISQKRRDTGRRHFYSGDQAMFRTDKKLFVMYGVELIRGYRRNPPK